jgi:hypothetical protein
MSVAQFRARPLTGTRRDRELWVEPDEALETLQRTLGLGFNTIVTGLPGAGVTSLLNQVAASAEDDGRRVSRVWAGQAESSTALLDAVSDAIEVVEDPIQSTRSAAALRRLERAAVANPDGLIVVDEVPGGVGHDVFGRMRDELWGLPAQWLLGASDDDSVVLLQPPADAFFESEHRIGRLPDDQIEELLKRRDPEHELDDRLRARIVAQSDGNPASALALARQALVLPAERRESFLETDPVEDVRARIGSPAAKLFAELLRRGAAGPSDETLLRHMNWSRPRAYQVFQDLERNGLIRSVNKPSGRPGRPHKIYEVVA